MCRQKIFWKIEHGVFSIATSKGEVIATDLEGRIISATINRCTYRRSYQNRYLKLTYRNGRREVSPLGTAEGHQICQKIYSLLIDSIGQVKEGTPEVSSLLEKLRDRNCDWLREDSERILSIYSGSIPIVPPDQYFTVYIRLTKGCPWNNCRFCRLYSKVSYEVNTLSVLQKQIADIIDLLGEGIKSRRSVFLGDANALLLPTKQLIDALEIIKRYIGLPVYSFSDGFLTPKNKSVSDYSALRKKGMRRVYIGIESGSEEVLRLLNKPMDLEVASEEIVSMKEAGLNVSPILLSGIGGRLENEHILKSIRFISKLPLTYGDIVYISPLKIYNDEGFHLLLNELGTKDENGYHAYAQADRMKMEMKSAYREIHGVDPPFPIATYNLLETIY